VTEKPDNYTKLAEFFGFALKAARLEQYFLSDAISLEVYVGYDGG
jgi:hypothetical protein